MRYYLIQNVPIERSGSTDAQLEGRQRCDRPRSVDLLWFREEETRKQTPMAGEQVTISVTYEGTEQSIPLVVRPSLELSDEQVDRADSELRGLLRQNFQLPPDSRCFLYEAVSRRFLSAESFRDPSNLPVFPHRWVLSVEPSFQTPLKYGQQVCG